MKTIISMFILLVCFSCNDPVEELLPFKTDVEYQVGDHPNTRIIFFSDGRYHRTEDMSGFRKLPSDSKKVQRVWIVIDKIEGIWQVTNGILYLTDVVISECRCTPWFPDSDNLTPCDPDDLQPSFPLAEWYKNFRVTSITENKIVVRPNYLDDPRFNNPRRIPPPE